MSLIHTGELNQVNPDAYLESSPLHPFPIRKAKRSKDQKTPPET